MKKEIAANYSKHRVVRINEAPPDREKVQQGEQPSGCLGSDRICGDLMDGWRELLQAVPQTHMFTIAFANPYSDAEALQAVAQWVRFANRRLFGPRWKKGTGGLAGYVVAERHRVSFDFRGRLHFHVVADFSEVEMQEDELFQVLRDLALRLQDGRGRCMTNVDRVHLGPVFDGAGLVRYLAKMMLSPDWHPADNIAFLHPRSGLEAFCFPEKGRAELRARA